MDIVPQALRKCGRCKQFKPLFEFNKCKQRRDGLSSYCKSCNSAVCKQSDPQKSRDRAREYHHAHKHLIEFQQRMRARSNRWQREHWPKRLESARKWRQSHPEYARGYMIEWRKRNADLVRAYNRLRAAQKRAVTIIPFDLRKLEEKIRYWGGRCWMCGAPYRDIDHVKPLTKGGYHIIANLRPICRPCNQRKFNRWPIPEIPLRTQPE